MPTVTGVSINSDTLTFNSVDGAESYLIYNGNTYLGSTQNTTFDLSSLNLPDGTYNINVVAHSTGCNNSPQSSVCEYTLSSVKVLNSIEGLSNYIRQSENDLPASGDEFVEDDYIYKFGYKVDINGNWTEASFNGWGVKLVDNTKSSYGTMYTTILNYHIEKLTYTFYNCTNLTAMPEIPANVDDMSGCFFNCSLL